MPKPKFYLDFIDKLSLSLWGRLEPPKEIN